MKTIIIKTQAEFDALPDSFSEYTIIRIESAPDFYLIVNKAWESSRVVAWESSHVEARGSSRVVARESSHVVARGSSRVVARGSSHVEARESSHVEARGSSHVVARESSHVVAWGSSHVVAWGSVSVQVHGIDSLITLFGFAVAICLVKVKVVLKSKTCTVVNVPPPEWTVDGWLEREGVENKKGKVTLFKRASKDFKTQEGKPSETLWLVNSKIEHPTWEPTGEECNGGKFHACSRPYFCDEFRNGDRTDIYIAIQVSVKDMHAWPDPQYPHKIAFRAGKVLGRCDQFGKMLEGE